MSQNRGDTSPWYILRAQEWPPRESDENGARRTEFSVHQSNSFRRATISRRTACTKVRAGTPQNTSSAWPRALCALATAGRMQGPSHPACPQDTPIKGRPNPPCSRSTRITSTPAIDHHRSNTTRTRARARAHAFLPARARAPAPVRSCRAVTMKGRPMQTMSSRTTRVLSSSGACSRRQTVCECSARTRIPQPGRRTASRSSATSGPQGECGALVAPPTLDDACGVLAGPWGPWKPSGRVLATYTAAEVSESAEILIQWLRYSCNMSTLRRARR